MDIDLLLPDVLRKLENLVRTGTIAEVRHELPGALVRVRTGKNVTDWRPYHELRAGNTRTWNPPTVGEQVTLLSPGGDLAGALVIGGIHQNDHPAPSTDPNKTVTVYPDGATVSYDHAAHALAITLPAGGTADITVPDRITVHCTTANVTASDSATVHSQQITLDAPQTTTTGHLTVMGLTTMLGGFSASGASAVPGAQSVGRMSIPLLSTREIETTSTVSADTDVRSGPISLRTHAHDKVQQGTDLSGLPQ